MLNSEPINDNHAVTKSYVDSVSGNDRNGVVLYTVSKDQHNKIDETKLTNLDSVTFNRNPLLDVETFIKKYVNDGVEKSTTLRINQTRPKNLEVCAGNTVDIRTNNDGKQKKLYQYLNIQRSVDSSYKKGV